MSKEICISSTPHETRLAILEDEQLTEVYYERENEYTLAGSIYKGRVTRVLPGMQSAFVDLGLERDAFLYVTDFMEEQEDSSDFERIPGSGEDAARPREPRESREPREQQNRQPRAAATEEESTPRRNGAPAGSQGSASSGQAPGGEFEDGTRRWRGRRGRRKGFRPPQGGQQQGTSDQTPQTGQSGRLETPRPAEPASEPDLAERRPSVPFALPGESLSKYGGQPTAPTASQPVENRTPQPKANVVLTKPSTLIETPIEWNGDGVLPGESISRYRGNAGEAPRSFPGEVTASSAPALQEEVNEAEVIPAAAYEPPILHEAATYEEEVVEAPEQAAPVAEPAAEPQAEIHAKVVEEPVVPAAEFEPEEASASYRVDPSAPSEFRFAAPSSSLLEEEEFAPEPVESLPEPEVLHPEANGDETAAEAAPTPGLLEPETDFEEVQDELQEDFQDELEDGTVATGLVEEEEVTDEEEYDFTPLYVESEDHDLQDLEEETLDQEVSVGSAIGDMVRDAHIDQRTDADASGLLVEEDEAEDELDSAEGVEEETESEEGQVAAVAGQPARRPRDDQRRGGRGQRNDGRRRHNGRRQNAQTSDLPIISELLKQGQEILVQIAKEPIAKKGARITSHIALPGRFLVFMPTVNHVGVSRKISSDEERQRLKRILISEKGTVSGGFIVRTAADGASEDDLRADIRFLISLWTEIKQRSDTAKAPALIYHDLNLVERILRDQVSDNFSTIWVDTEVEYERIVRFLNRFQPSLVRRVKLYTKETPLFEQFGIQDEITKALKSKVWLKSGGSIVINQTEALVAIDINTGKYVGKTARLEDTILKTNLDAIPEIVRQIRLRDLGGIIVIDFIDMDERKNRNKVMQALEEELKSDRAPSKVLQFNDFGLVAITRKRVKQSLERTLSTQCAICAGTGMVKSPTTVCNEIYTEMRKMQSHLERQDVLLRVHPEVVKTLKLTNARWLNELEEMSGKTIIVKSDPTLHPEQFDIH
jgi:Rne/Rng family ribonuclease